MSIIITAACKGRLDQSTSYKTVSASFHLSSLSHRFTPCRVCSHLSLAAGGQLVSDRRIRAADPLPGAQPRKSPGDPQHLFLFYQLCRG